MGFFTAAKSKSPYLFLNYEKIKINALNKKKNEKNKTIIPDIPATA